MFRGFAFGWEIEIQKLVVLLIVLELLMLSFAISLHYYKTLGSSSFSVR